MSIGLDNASETPPGSGEPDPRAAWADSCLPTLASISLMA